MSALNPVVAPVTSDGPDVETQPETPAPAPAALVLSPRSSPSCGDDTTVRAALLLR